MANADSELLSVLVVEDSQLTAEQIQEILRSFSACIQIKIVQSPKDAIEVARQLLPQVVVLDLQLKHGSGFTVLKALNTLDPRPKFIVLTNYALPAYRNYALLTGADFFLDKAKDMDKLYATVDSISRKEAGSPHSDTE